MILRDCKTLKVKIQTFYFNLIKINLTGITYFTNHNLPFSSGTKKIGYFFWLTWVYKFFNRINLHLIFEILS